MPGPITRGIAPELLEARARAVMFKDYDEREMLYTQFVATVQESGAWFDDIRLAGVGRFKIKPEGTPVAFSSIVQGLRRREWMLTFALGLRITREMKADEQWAIINEMLGDLRSASVDSKDRFVHGAWNDAFTGTRYLGTFEGDGQRRALFSTVHVPLRNIAAVQSNRLNPGIAISVAGFQAALNLAAVQQSDEERFIRVNYTKLVTHPNERWNTEVTLESEYRPNSTNNDINTVTSNRIGIQPVYTPYQNDPDAWGIFAQPREASKAPIRYHEREGLNTWQDEDRTTRDSLEMASYRCQVSIGDHRYAIGSSPP